MYFFFENCYKGGGSDSEVCCTQTSPCGLLASFPSLPHFYLPFAFIIIHGIGEKFLFPCVIVKANGR